MEQLISESILETFVCSYNRSAYYICTNKNCSQLGFICQVADCNCKKIIHSSCHFTKLFPIISQLNSSKIQPSFQIKSQAKQIQNIYDEIIQKLSLERINFVNEVQHFGLKKFSINFVQNIVDNHYQMICGKLVYEVQKQIQNQSLKLFAITEDQLLQKGKSIKNKIKEIIQSIREFQFETGLNSSIVSKANEDLLKTYFQKDLKGFRLLYRASENKYKAQAFHRKCDGVQNTLVIALTQFGNIIGGFSSKAWSSPTSWEYTADNSGESFIFSLTCNEKLTLINKHHAIYNNKFSGPIFGDGCDLFISDSCNIYDNSYCNLLNSYQSQKYSNENHLISKFTGSPSGTFKILEYQVIQVLFAR